MMYYLLVAFSVAVGIYGAVRLRMPAIVKLLFVLLSLTFGVAAAATGLIHTGPRAVFSFAICLGSVVTMGLIWWRYEEHARKDAR